MSANLAQRIGFETARSVGFASIGAGYIGIGTAITNPARIVFLQNLTDVTLWFSDDGINDKFPLPANGFLLLDVTTNRADTGGALYLAQGERLYVKQLGVPTSGAVYLSVIYGKL